MNTSGKTTPGPPDLDEGDTQDPQGSQEPQDGSADGSGAGSESAAEFAPESGTDAPRGVRQWAVIVLTLLGVGVTLNQVFFLNLGGGALLTNSFLYLLLACFVPIAFLLWPAGKGIGPELHRRWYDVLIAAAFAAGCLYLAAHGEDIQLYGWEYVAPFWGTVSSFLIWATALEALRRCAGWIIAVIALAFSVYPLVAEVVPIAFLRGVEYDLTTLAQVHVMGAESLMGLPLQTAGKLLVGFLLFGVVLQYTGGAGFFNDLANALFGRYRGGSAKVTVASSASIGMMSGSAVSNVLTTGPMTIPAMRRSGISARMAGAIEASASSGGSITPPIMGTAAFLMVSFAGVPYAEIVVAASIPALLYFLGMFVQIDAYAAQNDLKGTPRHLLPKVGRSLLAGWPYLLALVLLATLIFVGNSESQAPFWVVLLLLLIACLRPGIRFGFGELKGMVTDLGETLAKIISIIAGVGLILGGLSYTGVALSLSRDLVSLVDGNVVLILVSGAFVCFVLGMGMTISAAYVFLAIVMVPAVTALGIDPIAAHLFVIYWASVSYITPPVGLAAFAAAGISKASAIGTCFSAMRLGAVKYIVPFGFVLNPALVAQGTLPEILVAFGLSAVAVFFLGCAMSGWLSLAEVRLPVPARAALGVFGFLLFLPNPAAIITGLLGVTALTLTMLAVRRSHERTRP